MLRSLVGSEMCIRDSNHGMSQTADDKLSLKRRGQRHVTNFRIYTPLNISETAEAKVVKFCGFRLYQVLTFGQLIDPARGVAMVT